MEVKQKERKSNQASKILIWMIWTEEKVRMVKLMGWRFKYLTRTGKSSKRKGNQASWNVNLYVVNRIKVMGVLDKPHTDGDDINGRRAARDFDKASSPLRSRPRWLDCPLLWPCIINVSRTWSDWEFLARTKYSTRKKPSKRRPEKEPDE